MLASRTPPAGKEGEIATQECARLPSLTSVPFAPFVFFFFITLEPRVELYNHL